MSSIDNLNSFRNSLNRRTSNDILKLLDYITPVLNELNDRMNKLELLFQDGEEDQPATKKELEEAKTDTAQPANIVAVSSTTLQPLQEQPKTVVVESLTAKPDNVDSKPVGYTTIDIEDELEKTLSAREKHNSEKFKSILRTDQETKKKLRQILNSQKSLKTKENK